MLVYSIWYNITELDMTSFVSILLYIGKYLLTGLLTHSLTYLLTYLLTNLLTHSLAHSLAHSLTPTHSLTRAGYMSIMSLTFFIVTGTIGYFACYWFVWKIYGSIKVD